MQFLVNTFDNGKIDWTNQTELLQLEAKNVWQQYQKCIVRNIWFTEDKDAVLVLECDSIENAISVMDQFPLVLSGLIKYKIKYLLPYNGLERLMNGTSK